MIAVVAPGGVEAKAVLVEVGVIVSEEGTGGDEVVGEPGIVG